MPKPKSFLKDKPKKKTKLQLTPVTADDFLAAGVEFEEAGEKWRAGDAIKSLRFFMRAIGSYDEGLQKHPRAFDLAYNKARVQYEITQHPKLAAQLTAPQADVLRTALSSHRLALKLDQDNDNVLFNCGQVLNSLAEAMSGTKHTDEEELMQACTFLQEAVELFQRCLMIQEMKYTEMQVQIDQMDSADPEAQPPRLIEQLEPEKGPSVDTQEQWAAIVEPVTKNTLVDTAIAQLDTMTTLCGLLTSIPGRGGVGWVQQYSSEIVQTRLPAYLEGSDRQYEAALARGKFIAALHDVLYRSGNTDMETYQYEVSQAFGPDLDVSLDAEGLCSKAEALTSLSGALSDIPPSDGQQAFNAALSVRWHSLSTALDAFASASRLPTAENLPKIHLARGDAEMQRWRLGMAPWNYAMAQQNSAMLLKNAQTYYRGAAALAQRDGAVEEQRDGSCKEAIAAAMGGETTKLDQLKVTAFDALISVAQDMVEDGVIDGSDMSALIS